MALYLEIATAPLEEQAARAAAKPSRMLRVAQLSDREVLDNRAAVQNRHTVAGLD
jgi:hypothetical protein